MTILGMRTPRRSFSRTRFGLSKQATDQLREALPAGRYAEADLPGEDRDGSSGGWALSSDGRSDSDLT
jgi:hypothetical protein